MKKTILLILIILFFNLLSLYADFTSEQINELTNIIRNYDDNWTIEKTEGMLNVAKNSGDFRHNLVTDKGRLRIQIIGETILINGKDITGNLGSKITHGNYSPILENVQNSEISIGPASIAKNKEINVNLYLSIAFSLSLAFYFIWRILKNRRKRRTK